VWDLILSLYVNPEIHPRRASSAHTYRLLVFKDRSAHSALPYHHHPAPLRSASLHLQQRNEIMKSEWQVVNPLRRIFFHRSANRRAKRSPYI